MLPLVIDFILHIDKYLHSIISEYSSLTYLILFLVIFLETGLVITPFLPGDSLLFTVGAFSALGSLNVWWSCLIIFIAAVLGDTANYHIGKYLGPKVFRKEDSFFFHKEHLVRTQKFYEKHGGKTIILARFIPIIRTFAPFVAGIGRMSYKRFLSYNIIGGAAWSAIFIFGGYFLGNIPVVKENFSLFIILIIFISFIPVFKEIYSHYSNKKKAVRNFD
jgi:membrane-associated protein